MKTIETELLDKIPKDQIDRVFEQEMCEIDGSFLGFIDIYKALSEVIPKHFTIVDLGCAYNPQCFYFKGHKKYIAVDLSSLERFTTANCEFYQKDIQDFLRDDIDHLNLKQTFAILSYVPDWSGEIGEQVRRTFPNLFIYYPNGE